MKRLIAILFGVFAITSGSALSSPDDGTDWGNGGDEYSKQFIELGIDILESLVQQPLPGVNNEQLMAAIQNTKVNSVAEELILNGHVVDAINYPFRNPPQIVLSRLSWDRLSGLQEHRRAFLVLHEYLGIMGVDDSRYQISGMLDRASVCGRAPGARLAIEAELKKSCYRIIRDDLKYVTYMDMPLGLGQEAQYTKKDFKGLSALRVLYSGSYGNDRIADDLFIENTNLVDLHHDGSMNLKDCKFLNPLKKLKSFSIGRVSKDVKFAKEISFDCFVGRNIQNIGVSIDGSYFQGKLFEIPLQASTVSIVGTGLDHVSINEFKTAKEKGFSGTYFFYSGDMRPISESFKKRVVEATGTSCSMGHTGSEKMPTMQCRKWEH
jgi:hypothetical protein